MSIRCLAGFLIVIAAAGMALSVTPADAHSFNVTLVIPSSPEGREIRDGFMLATTERDSHPDEESDGHLGGLDVYVTVIEAGGNLAVNLGGQADIVAAFGTADTLSRIAEGLEGTGAVMLTPGQSPFAGPETAGVAAFKTAYEAAYGAPPTSRAADGYNAARRIDHAVRPLDGADDRAALVKSFSETARDFTW